MNWYSNYNKHKYNTNQIPSKKRIKFVLLSINFWFETLSAMPSLEIFFIYFFLLLLLNLGRFHFNRFSGCSQSTCIYRCLSRVCSFDLIFMHSCIVYLNNLFWILLLTVGMNSFNSIFQYSNQIVTIYWYMDAVHSHFQIDTRNWRMNEMTNDK